MEIKLALESNKGDGRIVDALIVLAEKSTICIGERNFYETDYTFICQVS